MTRILLLAATFAAILQTAPVTFTTIASGDSSQIDTERTATARTATEWAALWKQHGGEGKPPAVDFTKDMVIGLFAGTRPTAGHAVEIGKMHLKGDTLLVEYRVRGPKADEMVAQMLTTPFQIVRTAAHPKVSAVQAR